MVREKIEEIAKEVREAREWNFDLLTELADEARIYDKWSEADGDNFEEIIEKIECILEVELFGNK